MRRCTSAAELAVIQGRGLPGLADLLPEQAQALRLDAGHQGLGPDPIQHAGVQVLQLTIRIYIGAEMWPQSALAPCSGHACHKVCTNESSPLRAPVAHAPKSAG